MSQHVRHPDDSTMVPSPALRRRAEAVEAWARLSASPASHVQAVPVQDKPRASVYCLEGAAPDGGDVIAKRCSQQHASIERLLYEVWLPRLPVACLTYYGAVGSSASDDIWIFIAVAPEEVYSTLDPDHRTLAAEWLLELHMGAAAMAHGSLPDRGFSFWRLGYNRLIEDLSHGLTQVRHRPEQHDRLNQLLNFWKHFEEFMPQIQLLCEAMPHTLIHGDLLPKNMRIRDGAERKLVVFDWEYAGLGPIATDLAQSDDGHGGWAMADLDRYHAGIREICPSLTRDALQRAASVARLLHFLSWSRGDAENLQYEWKDRSVDKLTAYVSSVGTVLADLDWA